MGKTVGNTRDTMSIYSRVGFPYRIIGRSDIAKTIYLNYIRIGEENNFEITDMIVHIGIVAACYYEIGNFDSAFFYYKQADDYQETNMSICALKTEYKRRMADIHLNLGDTNTSISLLKNSHQWFSENGFLRQAQMAARQIGDIYLNLKDYEKSEIYFLESMDLVNEMLSRKSFYRYDSLKYVVSYGMELYLPFTTKYVMESALEEAVILYDHFYKYYMKQDQLRPAIKYLIARSDAKDSLLILQHNRESIEIQTRYESARKDTEILTLSQQNELKELQLLQSRWLLLGLGGLVVLILLLAIVLIRQNKLKNSQQTLLLQQRLFRAQMNPHFIFNSLSSIQGFMIEQDTKSAGKYLTKFAKLIRNILDNSTEEFVSLDKEISTIENYLALQKIRYHNRFEYTIDLDETINPELTRVPPMLAQPFIENSIEHGFKQSDVGGHIQIDILQKDRSLFVKIEDNGIGREAAMRRMKAQSPDHKSMATDITRQRISALNKKLKKKITLDIVDLKNEQGGASGTRVVFRVPLG